MEPSERAAIEQRFAHLLQPIKDLTRNWNIDITSELENYLEEIESIAVTFDGGKTTLNFAEAALLIQGSACVYSKKVEYLHALVYQVLDLLASKKKLKQASSIDQDDNDKDAARLTKQQDEEFLSLDDIKESKNIDLKNDTDKKDQSVAVLPRLSLCLIPFSEAEKGENPLISHKGEVLGSQNDFKMNTCHIHPSGTLLLDLSHLNLLELSLQQKPSSTPFIPRTKATTEVPPSDQAEMMCDEGLACDLSMEDHAEGFDLPPDDQAGDKQSPSPHVREHHDRQTSRKTERNKNMIVPPSTKLDMDPWITLEPHEEHATEKPFVKRKTFRIPPSLMTSTSKKRKRKSSLGARKQKLMPLTEFCSKAFYSRTVHFPQNPLKVPVHKEFEDLYWAEFKRRQTKLREECKMLKRESHLKNLAEDLIREEDVDDVIPLGVDEDDDNDGSGDGLIPINLDQCELMSGLGQEHEAISDDINELEGVPVVSSYEELVQQYIEKYLADAQRFVQTSELMRHVAEWEDRILPILEEEERHGPFDIHKSGTEVIRCLERHGRHDDGTTLTSKKIPFRKICANKPVYEVCRLFLSTLQLANTYNVEILTEGCLEEGIDTMSVQLLSTKRQFEELETYQVPSSQT